MPEIYNKSCPICSMCHPIDINKWSEEEITYHNDTYHRTSQELFWKEYEVTSGEIIKDPEEYVEPGGEFSEILASCNNKCEFKHPYQDPNYKPKSSKVFILMFETDKTENTEIYIDYGKNQLGIVQAENTIILSLSDDSLLQLAKFLIGINLSH